MRKKAYYQKIYDVNTWLNIHVGHLSYTRNLVLTLAIAGLGFTISQSQKIESLAFPFSLLSSIFLLGTVIIGIIIAFNQSENYRLYRIISRKIEQTSIEPNEMMDEKDFEKESKEIKRLENINDNLIKQQLQVFVTGIILLSVTFLLPAFFD